MACASTRGSRSRGCWRDPVAHQQARTSGQPARSNATSRLRSVLVQQGLTSAHTRTSAIYSRYARTRVRARRMAHARPARLFALVALVGAGGPAMTKCLGCQRRMTWAEQRVQFGRLLRRAFTVDQTRRVLPRCQKCVTTWLRSQAAAAGAADSAPAHAAPVHASRQGGPAANGSSLAEKRRKATRERTPFATEFVLSVRTTAPGRDVARLGPTWADRVVRRPDPRPVRTGRRLWRTRATGLTGN